MVRLFIPIAVAALMIGGVAVPADAKPKKAKKECTVTDGRTVKVTCKWLEHCVLSGGTPGIVDGKAVCCTGAGCKYYPKLPKAGMQPSQPSGPLPSIRP